jgi:RecA-family ATPase
VAAGGRVAGIACQAGAALVVDAENGPSEIHRRLWALELPARAAARLHVLEARALDLRSELPQLERRIAACAPDLVVLDSFRSLWSGRERSDAEVEALQLRSSRVSERFWSFWTRPTRARACIRREGARAAAAGLIGI